MIHSIQRDQKQGHCTYLSHTRIHQNCSLHWPRCNSKRRKREINKHKYENFLAFSPQSPLSESQPNRHHIILSSTKLNNFSLSWNILSNAETQMSNLILPAPCLSSLLHPFESSRATKQSKYIMRPTANHYCKDLTPATLSETNVLYQNQSQSSKKSLQGRGSCKDPVVHAGLSLRAAADALIHASTYASPSSTNTLYQVFIPLSLPSFLHHRSQQ